MNYLMKGEVVFYIVQCGAVVYNVYNVYNVVYCDDESLVCQTDVWLDRLLSVVSKSMRYVQLRFKVHEQCVH